MNRTIKIILSIATLVTTLATLSLAIYALTIPHFGLFISCLALALAFGLFVRNDYYYFFQKKDQTK